MPSCSAYTIDMKMVRTQVQLTEQQMRSLRRLAEAEGVSMAAMVRQCVDQALEAQPQSRAELYAQAQGLVGSLHDSSGAKDLSSHHDRYLDEAFA